MEAWPALAETDAAHVLHLGTTGHPKGAVYTHRAIFLHSMASSMTDLLASTSATSSCTSCRCSTPTPGACRRGRAQRRHADLRRPTPAARHRGDRAQRAVTFVGAVPTVWIAIDAILESEPRWDISSIRCIRSAGRRRRARSSRSSTRSTARRCCTRGADGDEPAGHRVPAQVLYGRAADEERYTIRAKQATSRARGHAHRGRRGVEQPWTARAWARSRCAGRGSSAPTTTIPNRSTGSPPTAGSARATSRPSIRGLRADHRPHEGPHQVRRRVDLVHRRRDDDHGPSQGAGAASSRCRIRSGGAPPRLRRAQARHDLDPREIVEYLRPRLAKFALPDEVVLIEAVRRRVWGSSTRRSCASASRAGRRRTDEMPTPPPRSSARSRRTTTAIWPACSSTRSRPTWSGGCP